jgi:putative methionine-R-sulfoxide reductase with GAF domain
MSDARTVEGALKDAIREFGCTSGTVHRADGDTLHLVAAEDIPGEVLERVETVPIGKGMAGVAAERREPVATCDLQADDGGVAKEGARATGLKGTIAVPMLSADGTLEGVLGVGKPEEHEFSAREREDLLDTARRIAEHV